MFTGLPNIDFLPPAQNYVQPRVPPVQPLQPVFDTPGPTSPTYPPALSVRVPPIPPPEYLSSQPPPSGKGIIKIELKTSKSRVIGVNQ